jgi:hypothetical protein
VAARRVHEELQRIERARDRRSRDGASLLRSLLAHDDVALLERDAKAGEVVLGQLVLVRQSLDVLLLDESALGGLLEQALDRREVMQVNRVAQCRSFRSWWAAGFFSAPGGVRASPRGAATHVIYRTALHRSPFPNRVFFLFPNKVSFPA